MAKKDTFTLIDNTKELEKAFESMLKVTGEKTFLAFGEIGEKVVNQARTEKTYKDQTANLKSSTGYIIVEGSKLSKKDYKKVKGSIKSDVNGTVVGLEIAKESSDATKNEIELIIDAGMDYASYVEKKGKNVLTAFIPTAGEVAKLIEKRFDGKINI